MLRLSGPRVAAAAFLGAFWTIAGCTVADYVQRPPVRFQQPTEARVRTVPSEMIGAACKGSITTGEPPGNLVGCYRAGVVIVPNPAEWADPFAQLLAHELAHVQGWPSDHPK